MDNNAAESLQNASPLPRGTWLIQLADSDGNPLPMKSTAIRMPESMLARLDELAGRDIEGRSGVVRKAVAEYLNRLEEVGP